MKMYITGQPMRTVPPLPLPVKRALAKLGDVADPTRSRQRQGEAPPSDGARAWS